MRPISRRHGAMLLFVKGFPITFTPPALRCHVLNTLRVQGILTWRQGSLGSCDIVRVLDRDTGTIEYYGLIEMRPAKLALQVIRQLNGVSLQGRTLEVHRYHHRSLRHERRLAVALTAAEIQPDRRQGERRRSDLRLELLQRPQIDLTPWLFWTLPPWFNPKSPEKLG